MDGEDVPASDDLRDGAEGYLLADTVGDGWPEHLDQGALISGGEYQALVGFPSAGLAQCRRQCEQSCAVAMCGKRVWNRSLGTSCNEARHSADLPLEVYAELA